MIQEYLFINKTEKEKIEQYTPEGIKIEIYDIDNSDCWILTFFLPSESEPSANVLSKVHDYIIGEFHPIVLSNGCSAYYNKALFPHFNEFERKLRKLLYLKSALSKNSKDAEIIKDLESKDFGEIFTLLFSDAQFVQNAKKTIGDKTWQFTKAEIIAAIELLSEHTVWDNLIGKDAVPLLRSDFIKVKNFRNDVMHAHAMNAKSYSSASKLIKKINEQLDTEIGKIIVAKENTVQQEVEQDFNTAMGDAIKDMDSVQSARSWQEQLAELQAMASGINSSGMISAIEEYRRLAKSPEIVAMREYLVSSKFSDITKHVQEISKIQLDIPPVVKELQELAASMKEYKITVPQELLELQKSLKNFKPDPALIELAKSMKEITGETK
jgi:hypothetical protein